MAKLERGALLLILLVGWALAMARLGERSLWADEGFGAYQAELAWSKGLGAAIRLDPEHMPLHLLVLAGAVRLGRGEIILRFPSAMATLLAVAVVYRLAARLSGRAAGLTAALLLALSPFAVGYAQEARTYAVLELLACLSFLLLLVALERNKPCRWVAFAVASSLLLYAHYFAWFVLAAEVLFAWAVLARSMSIARRFDARLPWLLVSLAGVTMFYLPWLPAARVAWRQIGPGGKAHQMAGLRSFQLSLRFFHDMVVVFGSRSGGWSFYLSVAALGLGLVGLVARHKWQYLVLVALWFGVPLAGLSLMSSNHFFDYRYLIFLLPLFLLLTAEGVVTAVLVAQKVRGGACWHRLQPMLALGLAVALFVPANLPALRAYHGWEKENWRNIGAFLARELLPDEVVYVSPRHIWSYPLLYYQPSITSRLVGGSPDNLAQLVGAAQKGAGLWFLRYGGPLADPTGALTAWITEQGFDLLVDSRACGWGIDVYYRRFSAEPPNRQADLWRQAAKFCPSDPRFAALP